MVLYEFLWRDSVLAAVILAWEIRYLGNRMPYEYGVYYTIFSLSPKGLFSLVNFWLI